MSYESTILAESGLVSFWKLDETSGTSAADSKGSNTGTYNGSPTLNQARGAVGMAGSSVAFAPGSSQYVSVADSASLKGLSGLTIEAWVKFNSLPGTGAFLMIASKVGSYYFGLYNNSGTYQLGFSGNSVDVRTDQNWTPTTGRWYHMAATWQTGTNNTRIYVDGVQVGTSYTMNSAMGSSATAFEIGRFNGTYYMDGSIDAVALYNTPLSVGTLLSHYNLGIGLSATDSITATDSASAVPSSAAVSASDSATATDSSATNQTRYLGGTLTGTIKVLTVGDSNTSGGYAGIAWSVWPDRVQSALAAAFPSNTITLTNNAVGGTTSYDLLTAYATAIGDESPSVVVIMHGTNDAWYDDPLGGYPRGDGADYSAAAYTTRLSTLVDNALGLTDAAGRPTKVVLCTPPPAAVQADGTSLWRDSVRLSAIREAVRSVAATKRVRYVDPWGAIQAAAPSTWKSTYLNDGVHLKSAGQQLVADLVTAAIQAELSAPIGDYAYATDTAGVTVGVGAIAKTASDSATATDTAGGVAVTYLLTASDSAMASDSGGGAGSSVATYTRPLYAPLDLASATAPLDLNYTETT